VEVEIENMDIQRFFKSSASGEKKLKSVAPETVTPKHLLQWQKVVEHWLAATVMIQSMFFCDGGTKQASGIINSVLPWH